MPSSSPSHRTVFAADLMADKLCVVTGGGTGIGLATARMLYACGAKLALLGRRLEVTQAAAKALDAGGERVMAAACDIRDPETVATAVAAIKDRFGPIDVLVNNAGGQFPAPAETISPNGFEAVVRNNLFGTWNMTREVVNASMLPEGGGVIVNIIANIARGFPGMVHTGAARAGVENMTRTLAIEWVSRGIRINAVAPGIIETEALSKYPIDVLAVVKKTIPMKRSGTVEETAHCIVFLCSDASTYVTGETLYVDGGARLWGETWPIPDPD